MDVEELKAFIIYCDLKLLQMDGKIDAKKLKLIWKLQNEYPEFADNKLRREILTEFLDNLK